MSRSNQTEFIRNPATMNIEWSGSEGNFHYWDKEKKEQISLDGIRFAVLDELSCVRGWIEEQKSNAFSNETHNLKSEPLVVKFFKDGKPRTLTEGFYSDIKDNINAQGIKYNKVIYALLLDTNVIVRIYIKGAAMSAWIDKGFNGQTGIIEVNDFIAGQKGAVKFKMPKFVNATISSEDDALAIEADKELQAYFKQKPVETESVPDAVTDKTEPAEPEIPAEEEEDFDENLF